MKNVLDERLIVTLVELCSPVKKLSQRTMSHPRPQWLIHVHMVHVNKPVLEHHLKREKNDSIRQVFLPQSLFDA
jgi:hypothetical protein